MKKMTTKLIEILPELNDEETSTAQDNVNWAAGFLGLPPGTIHEDNGGVLLQVVSTRTVRCLAVVDHPYSYLSLAMMALSFETAGMTLEFEPYTIIMPMPREEEQEECVPENNHVGMEVA